MNNREDITAPHILCRLSVHQDRKKVRIDSTPENQLTKAENYIFCKQS